MRFVNIKYMICYLDKNYYRTPISNYSRFRLLTNEVSLTIVESKPMNLANKDKCLVHTPKKNRFDG